MQDNQIICKSLEYFLKIPLFQEMQTLYLQVTNAKPEESELMKWIIFTSPGERKAAFWMVFSAIFFSVSAELLPIANWFTAVYSNAFCKKEKEEEC